jgi:hypothetical protein
MVAQSSLSSTMLIDFQAPDKLFESGTRAVDMGHEQVPNGGHIGRSGAP